MIGWKCSILSYSNDKIERRKGDSKRVSFLLRVRLDSITCYLKKSCELHKDAKQRSRTKRKAAGIDENIPSGKFHRFYFREVKRKCINAQTMRIFVFYTPRKSGCSTLVRKFPFFFFFFFFFPPPLLVGAIVGNRKPRTGLFTWRRHAMLAKLLQMCTVSMTLSRRKHLSRYSFCFVQKENGRNISNSRFLLDPLVIVTRVSTKEIIDLIPSNPRLDVDEILKFFFFFLFERSCWIFEI